MSLLEPHHAETAQAAYLSLLRSKGAATSLITRRKHFLRHLASALGAQAEAHIADDDAGYRLAVDQTLARFPDDQRLEIISAAREFYPFWTGDLKTIARLNAADALTLEQAPIDLHGSLGEMFERMDADPWAGLPQQGLDDYLGQLDQRGTEQATLDIRERLLKLLLYIIRHADETPMSYRAGVDAMLTLFSREDSRRLFIEMAREFFYCWHGARQDKTFSQAA